MTAAVTRKFALAAAVFATLSSCQRPAYAHGAAGWIMADPLTRHCCGPQDCRPLHDGEARFDGATWTVNGRAVPPANIYPTGPDGGASYWACFRLPALVEPRCLFIPAMY